jgi:signal transduction histidine kinase
MTTLASSLLLHRAFRFDGMSISFSRALLWQGVVYFSWAALVPLIAWIGRRFPVGRNPWLQPFPAFVAASAVIIPAHALLTAWATWLARPAPPGAKPPWETSWQALLVDRVPIDLLIYWGIVGALYAVSHYRALREQERTAAALEIQLARAQLHTLSTGLQPHFLFNALQAISTLVRRRPDDAVRMIAHLGDLLRETLRRSGKHTVPLRDELSVLQHYLAIEGVRMGDRLRVELDIEPDAAHCFVPALLLQPIVENAVRHGLSEKPDGGAITVVARLVQGTLRITVEDTGAGLPAEGIVHEGIGLSNTRERLRQLYGNAARLEVRPRTNGNGVRVELELPSFARELDVAVAS